ncbi:MAG: AI-2E family transporter [Burkholderiales bacterium]|nr:AI-2E family transporter [Burkholderiales bacterium]
MNRLAGLAALALLALGTVVVLKPFIAAGLFAAVFVMATWPAYAALRRALRGSDAWAATLMTVGVVVLVVLPFAWLVENAIERVPRWVALVRGWLVDGLPPPPAWLARVPLAGPALDEHWRALAADPGALRDLGKRLVEVSRGPLLSAGAIVGEGILQLALATFVGFFFYRDGEAIVASLRAGVARLAGPLGEELIATVQTTVRAVVLGILGTALAQGLLATIGFAVAGLPAPLLLGGLTALVSPVPGGPVFVWLGATFWLLAEEQFGWAVFMFAWGAGLVSSIDNVVRPLLISRGASLSFGLVFVGVVGGIVAFGFVGVFIGPALLALAWRLWQVWVEHEDARATPPDDAPR